MKKNIIYVFACLLMIVLSFAGFNVKVKAASDKIAITSYTSGSVSFENLGGNLTKKIVASDKKNGVVTIELAFSNTEKTEVYFLVDRSYSSASSTAISTSLTNTVDALMDTYDDVGIGFSNFGSFTHATTTDANSYSSAISTTKSDVLNNITALFTNSVYVNNLEDKISDVSDAFSDDTINKVLVLIIEDYEESTNVNDIQDAIQGLDSDVILYTVILSNAESDTIFGSSSVPLKGFLDFITSANLNSVLSTNVDTILKSVLPKDKTNVIVTDYFTTNILKGFDVVYGANPNIGTVGEFDTTNKKFVWNIGNLGINKTASFRFNLKLKDANKIPESLINTPINSNVKVNVTFAVSGSAVSGVGDYECSPSVKILEEAITNPKTGLINFILPVSIVSVISIYTYLIIKKKSKFVNLS